MVQQLRNTWAWDLDKFIEDYLLPNTRFQSQVKEAINTICDFLKERCFLHADHPVRVSKMVKGGSSGKGTTLKGRSNADLVVFLNNLTSFEEQFTRRGEFIEEIKKQLRVCEQEKRFQVKFEVQSSWWPSCCGLSFKLSSRELQQAVKFDVLPAYDALGHVSRPDPQFYIRLIRECTYPWKEGKFSTCFTELQRNFLKQRPAKLKSLIRLVKHWYQLYALELLTVYAWECGCGALEFNTAQGFRTVLELVRQHWQLRIYWTEYYDFENEIISDYLNRKLRKARPVILDPADPTRNVAGGYPFGWQQLAEEAKAWLEYQCVRNWNGSPMGCWDLTPEVYVPPFQEKTTVPALSCEPRSTCQKGSRVRGCLLAGMAFT